MAAPISILFVCAGNIFRSVTALHVFETETLRLHIGASFELYSAGLIATNGQPGEPELNRELKAMGYTQVNHAATELQLEMVLAADLILTAEGAQRSEIVRSHPQAASKTLTLKQMARIANGLADGIPGVPELITIGRPTAESLRKRLEHLLTYRGYAPNPDFDAIEDIEDPYETGKHKEAAREVRQAMLAIVQWWVR